MIIKSIGHSRLPVRVLVNYMLEDKGHRDNNQDLQIFHNLSGIEPEEIKHEFETLIGQKPKRSNGVSYFHEVLSFSPQSSPHLNEDILSDLAQTYLSKRAFYGLGWGVLHSSEDHIHLHFLLSSNRIDDPKKSLRLSKKEFKDIQLEIEQYQIQRYPELKDSLAFAEKGKERFRAPKERETIKTKLAEIIDLAFESSGSTAQLCESLDQNPDLTVYQYRGKPHGVIHGGKKYRFSTLGLTSEKMSILEKLDRLEKLREQREHDKNDDFNLQPK